MIPTVYNNWYCWTNSIDGICYFIKQTNKVHVVPVGVRVGPVPIVIENDTLHRIDNVSHGNNHVDFDIYWTVY